MKNLKNTLSAAAIALALAGAPAISCKADQSGVSAQPTASPHPTAAPDEIRGAGQPATSSGTPEPNTKARTTTQTKAPVIGLDHHDGVFVKDAGMWMLFETQIGKLAHSAAGSSDVRNFSERVVRENGTAGNKLKVVAMTQNIAMPDKLDAAHQKQYDELSKLKGRPFDIAYVEQMVLTSDQALMESTKAEPKTVNEDLKTFIVQTTPVIEKRSKQAKMLEKAVASE